MGDAAKNIAKAFELKEQGNEYFKAGDYKRAKVSYHEVWRLPRAPREPPRPEGVRHRLLRSSCTCTASRRGRGVA